MEKIPYKPGDVLVSYRKQNEVFTDRELEVIDVSKNGFVVFLGYESKENMTFQGLADWKPFYVTLTKTKRQLDEDGYTLKTYKRKKYDYYVNWEPKMNDDYYSFDVGGIVKRRRFTSDDIDKFFLKSGNCFRTREEAEEKLKEIMGREI